MLSCRFAIALQINKNPHARHLVASGSKLRQVGDGQQVNHGGTSYLQIVAWQ
jgi:hypothetical protein